MNIFSASDVVLFGIVKKRDFQIDLESLRERNGAG